MSEIVRIAKEVAESLKEYHAEFSLFPEYELHDLDKMKVAVVPLGTQYKIFTRVLHKEFPKVQIGILKRCTEEELPEMLEFTEKTGLGFLYRKFRNAVCVSVEFNPIYSPEHLRERNQFTSVIELGFEIVK